MKSIVLRLTLLGALAFGGMSFGAATSASAACIGVGGAYVCAPNVRQKHFRRHHPGVVLEFGRPHRNYYKQRYYRRHVQRDFYYGDPYRDRPYRRHFHGRYSPHWNPGWGDPADNWR